jgi:fumarylpyruvate hydrolase
MSYVFPPSAPVSVPVLGQSAQFPVHRIYCVGLNYEDHAKEMGHAGREAPFFFMKPADAILVNASGTSTMPYPTLTTNLHHEVELVVAIGVGGQHILAQDAAKHIYGYAVGLDMTRRDLQAAMKAKGRPWCIGKGFDHAAPIGPITPADQVAGITQADIALQVNGQERQRSTVAHLIWSVAEVIEQLSQAWTLQPGDLIYTGTPAGVGPVVRGDTLSASVQGLQSINIRVE